MLVEILSEIVQIDGDSGEEGHFIDYLKDLLLLRRDNFACQRVVEDWRVFGPDLGVVLQ